jgi:hypothetical protein
MPGSDATYLAALFDDMATNWQGWPGSKSWSALEGQLTCRTASDLGLVDLVACAGWSFGDCWQAVAEEDLPDQFPTTVHRPRHPPGRAPGRRPDRAGGRAGRDQHLRVQDGKVVERWGRTDDLGFLQQLEIVPALSS